MKRRKTPLAAALAGIALLGVSAAPALAQDYYAGKTITIVVPFSQGGATYVSAKFLEPFMENTFPAIPTSTLSTGPAAAPFSAPTGLPRTASRTA